MHVPAIIKKPVSKCIDVAFDRYLGIRTGPILDWEDRESDRYSKCVDPEACWPTGYTALLKMRAFLHVSSETVLVDLGCGTGRTVFFLSRLRLRSVIGVEANPRVFDLLQQNRDRFRFNKRTPIKLMNRDAATYEFHDETVLFMFNPFGKTTLSKVLENLRRNLQQNPRPMSIVYQGAVHHDMIQAENWIEEVPLSPFLFPKTTRYYRTNLV